MLTSDLNLSKKKKKNCKRIEILKCVLRTFIIIIIKEQTVVVQY